MTSSTSTAGSGSAAASALPPRAPGQAHNLTGWQLDTCLHSPRSVKAPALATYTDPNFFLGDDDTIVMLTPDNATAVTAHADHPRTEFRETGVADWELDSGEHVLSLLTAVLRVSSTNNETIIAQIHGSVNEEIAKVIKLRWTNGRVEVLKTHRLFAPFCTKNDMLQDRLGTNIGKTQKETRFSQARVKNHTAPHDEFGLDCGTYALGTPLSVEVRVAAGILAVEVNGKGITYKPPFNPADRFYFKAGDYNQCSAWLSAAACDKALALPHAARRIDACDLNLPRAVASSA
jgi:hypothetical protein